MDDLVKGCSDVAEQTHNRAPKLRATS
jgi:hypothetical protein